LADVSRSDQKLQKAETVDKSKLPEKAVLAAQIKAEKQDQKTEKAHTEMLESVTEGDYRLKRAETNEKNLAKRSKEELGEIIKAEKEAYKAQEHEERAKVLVDVTKDQKLKKAETVDKTVLPEKKELTSQIKAEKQAQVIDDARTGVLADVSKGEQKLKKTKTNDKSKKKKKDLAAEIQAEKEVQAHDKLLGDIVEGDHSLKKSGNS